MDRWMDGWIYYIYTRFIQNIQILIVNFSTVASTQKTLGWWGLQEQLFQKLIQQDVKWIQQKGAYLWPSVNHGYTMGYLGPHGRPGISHENLMFVWQMLDLNPKDRRFHENVQALTSCTRPWWNARKMFSGSSPVKSHSWLLWPPTWWWTSATWNGCVSTHRHAKLLSNEPV